MLRKKIASSIAALLFCAILFSILLWSQPRASAKGGPENQGAPGRGTAPARKPVVARDLSLRLAKYEQVEMPFRITGMTEQERAFVEKLVEACGYIESIF